MESPALNRDTQPRSLGRFGAAVLLLLCMLLFGFSLVQPRVFTTHETTHCLNVREMFRSGDWLIPTYGGRPWLERPPAPHWVTGSLAVLSGGVNSEWAMRLGSVFIATLAVLVFACAAAQCFGRTVGIMSGAILATMREFAAYAVGPEADIILASTVTICGALFLQLLNAPHAKSFFGRRSAAMLLFFVLLGLTNWMKGPLFGMIFVLMPAGAFFVWNWRAVSVRPFVWLWGWLALVGIGLAWPILAWLRYPDIVELWAVDYGVRWQSGYIGEPFWYYLVHQPWNVFPWTIPILAGLWASARTVWRSDYADNRALRFIWCWAILPVAFFSLFKGKHHHYMLSCLAPAAVLGAFGSVALWHWARGLPGRVRQPWVVAVVVGVPLSVLTLVFAKKIPGPGSLPLVLAACAPIVVGVMTWLAVHRDGRVAFAGTCAVIVTLSCLAYVHRSLFMDSYTADRAFVARVDQLADADKPLLVINDEHPLNSSWLLYYLGERAQLLHNHSFLRDERIQADVVHVICRQRHESALREFGQHRLLAQSAKARGETSTGDRWTLYELRYDPRLTRVPGNVRISPMQATGRRPGPYLTANSSVASVE